MLRDVEVEECYDCGATFDRPDLIEVPDDRDQMYGRPLSGTRTISVCPDCGSGEIGYVD